MDKKYNFQEQEPTIQEFWRTEKIYTLKEQVGPLYTIDTPPPTVSGSLHIGHLFSYTHTDIIARYKRLHGYSVFYPMGFDDNGLATERFVEKKHQVSPYSLGRSSFIALCEKETAIARSSFAQLWQTVGLSVDWQYTYSTISAPVRKISQESFIHLYSDGIIYRRYEPALYCTTCQTSVAQAELDDIQQNSFFNTIEFKTTDGKSLLIGTTRPELLPSCVAIFYHPDDSRYTQLQGKKARVPLYDFEVPLLPDEQVDPEKGTGLVMCCAFGDKTDLHWIKKYDFKYQLAIGTNGRWLPHTGILAGLKIAEARKTILEALQNNNSLKDQKPITHAVNVHERCKKEIEYIAISQWFLRVLDHKQQFIKLADQITWYPAFMKSRYINWVENLSWDWCLSRQRFYGIPFPVWHCTTCNEILVAPLNQLPIDPQETVYPGKHCTKCNGTDIKPDTDVMDTWNTSSLTPYICYQLYNPKTVSVFASDFIAEFMPMSMRPQAHDIIRTWAFYTIVKAWLHNKQIPWKSIVISGHVLTEGKEKLSKSQEQKKLDPAFLLSSYSADVLRYWTACGALGQDTLFAETQLKIGGRLVTKLWNAFLFIKEHTSTIAVERKETYANVLNQWILHQASACFAMYQTYFDKHEFNLALDTVERFFWHDFCDNYVELIKNQLFNPQDYAAAQIDETRAVLYHIGLRILQLYAPYLPHITDIIYQDIYRLNNKIISLHQTTFQAIQIQYNFQESAREIETILTIVATVRKLKTEQQLSLKTELDELVVHSQHKDIEAIIKKHEQLLRGITQAKNISTSSSIIAHNQLKNTDLGWITEIMIEKI